jgi:FixJ family two-component response regulator
VSKVPVIAVLDDDAAMRDALRDLLQVAGFTAIPYAGAHAFLADFAPGRFDLLVTDLRMPELGGVELLRRLRAMGANLPTIVVTSSSGPQTRAQALAEGALSCLTKPVPGDVLLRCIGSALDRD